MKSKFCKNCGMQLEECTKFCGNCGTQLEEGSKYCGSCGTQLEDGSKFCSNCGAQLEEAPKFCSNCGIQLEEDSKFCSSCGTVVKQKSHEPPIQQYQQPDTPKKVNKLPIIAGVITIIAVITAIIIWQLTSTARNIEAYNSIIDDIRELTDFHVSITHMAVHLDSEDEFYGEVFNFVLDTYTSGTLNESRTISTTYVEGDNLGPFEMQNVYIDGTEYRIHAPYLSLPDVLIYEQTRTRRMEEYDLSIEQHIQHVIFSEDILRRFLTRRDDLLEISVTGYDVVDFLQMESEENDGINDMLLHGLTDIDMTDAYITISLKRVEGGFRIANNSYFPGMHSFEIIIYISPWDPEPIRPFLREDLDSNLVDRELESQLWDERWGELDIPDFDSEQWDRAGDWADFTGFNFVQEHLREDLEMIRLRRHPPMVDFAGWYLRTHELNLTGFADVLVDFSGLDSMNADFRTISHLRYADEAILEMMDAIDDYLYINLVGFYFVRACEGRNNAKLVVLRWSYADDEPVVFLLAAQRTSSGNDMLILNIEVFLNRLEQSDVRLLRGLERGIWPGLLRDIHNEMNWSDLNLEEQLANKP